MIELCEFCGMEYPIEKLEATSFNGLYCRHCLELMIAEATEAINKIEERD